MRGRSRWQDGRRAWERLNGWHQRDPHATPGHPDTADAAVKALEDIHFCLGLLETAQLHAVETARRNGLGWVQIATALHLEPQIAADRWREVEAGTGHTGRTPNLRTD